MIFFGSMAVLGCGSMKTGTFTNYDSVPLHQYQTYAWASQTKSPSAMEGEMIDSARLDRWVREIVDQELTSRGLQLAPSGEADLTLSYYFFLREELQEVHNSAPYAQEWYQRGIYIPGGRIVGEMYSTLYINIVDARKEESIWLGWGTRDFKPRNLSKAEIQETVGVVLDQIPIDRK